MLIPLEETGNKLVQLKTCHKSCQQGVMKVNRWVCFSQSNLGRLPREVIFGRQLGLPLDHQCPFRKWLLNWDRKMKQEFSRQWFPHLVLITTSLYIVLASIFQLRKRRLREVTQLAHDNGADNWSGILEGNLTVSIQQQRQQTATKSA